MVDSAVNGSYRDKTLPSFSARFNSFRAGYLYQSVEQSKSQTSKRKAPIIQKKLLHIIILLTIPMQKWPSDSFFVYSNALSSICKALPHIHIDDLKYWSKTAWAIKLSDYHKVIWKNTAKLWRTCVRVGWLTCNGCCSFLVFQQWEWKTKTVGGSFLNSIWQIEIRPNKYLLVVLIFAALHPRKFP